MLRITFLNEFLFRVTREREIYEFFLIKYSQCMMHINSRINWLNLLISHNEIVITRNSNGHVVYFCVTYIYLCTGQLSISRDLFEVINYMMLFRAHFFFHPLLFFFCVHFLSVPQTSIADLTPCPTRINDKKKSNRTNKQRPTQSHSFSVSRTPNKKPV